MSPPISQTFGRPFWPSHCQSIAPAIIHPPLIGDARCDVAIVGAGITGALIAYELRESGARVVVLEQNTVGHASTSASTSLILYELDQTLCDLAEKIGEESAGVIYRATVAGVEQLVRIGHELRERFGMDADVRRRKSLYVATRPADAAPLKAECHARQKHGIDVEFLDAGGLEAGFSFKFPAALLSETAAEADPLKLA